MSQIYVAERRPQPDDITHNSCGCLLTPVVGAFSDPDKARAACQAAYAAEFEDPSSPDDKALPLDWKQDTSDGPEWHIGTDPVEDRAMFYVVAHDLDQAKNSE